MKLVSTMALGLALATGSAVLIGAQPAMAQKEKKAKPRSFNLSKPVREAIGAAQAALAKQDTATASAKVNEALAAASTPDDQFVSNSLLYDISRTTKDTAQQMKAVDGMIASGSADATLLPQLYLIQGNAAYQAKDYKKAEAALAQAVKLNTTQLDAYALLAESRAKNGNAAGALEALEAAIVKQKAAGAAVPSDWYGRGISIGYNAKLPQQTARLTQEWLIAYPTADNWRDSIITYRDLNKVDPDYELDLMRLLRTAKGLKGERDYYDYADAVYLKFPGEGKAVIDEGVAAGMLKLDPGGNTKMMSDTVNKRIAADKADLASAEKAARSAANGVSARATADSYLGYGEYAKAAELYKVALQKGGVDANVVNSRLGMALARAGQKDEAKQVFGQITGQRADLAKFWMIWMDQQGAAPAAAGV